MTALLLTVAAIAAPAPAAHVPGCNTTACDRRITNRYRRRVVRPYLPRLRRLEACESRGNVNAVSPTGLYTGLHQFDDRTWHSVGGSGRARDAGKLEQRYRAVLLIHRRGYAPWPVCGPATA